MTSEPAVAVSGIRFAAGTSEEEVAAVVALLAASGPSEPPAPPRRGGWSEPARRVRAMPAGPWRTSLRA